MLQRQHSSAMSQKLPRSNMEGYRVTASNGQVWLTGGFDVGTLQQLNHCFTFDGQSWSQFPNMNQGRFFHATFAFNYVLVVVGGYQREKVLSSVEILNSSTKSWRFGAPMPLGVGGAAFAAKDDSLFICCGQYSVHTVHTTDKIQRYSLKRDQWDVFSRYISPVFFPFSENGMGAAILQNKLYILGGQTVRVDALDLETREWERQNDTHEKRMDSQVLAWGKEKLIVCGGYDYTNGHYHDSIEELDIKSRKWRTISARLEQPLRNFGLAVIDCIQPNQI